MNFLEELNQHSLPDPGSFTENHVRKALAASHPGLRDLAALLSPAAGPLLESMAQRARALTRQHFGRVVTLFTPLYVSDYCTNSCVYCGFNARTGARRSQLSLDEVREEAELIASTGLRHVLLLTGDAPGMAGIDYLEACVRILKEYFSHVGIEIYALDLEGYRRLVSAGVESLTIYQETYQRDLYAHLHPSGPKKDFDYRLGAPERAYCAGMRQLNVGALLGLGDWRCDAFLAGLHADWLQRNCSSSETGISLPRMQPHAGLWQPENPVSDRELVQALTALRIFLPMVSITMSTRENAGLRDRLVQMGVTRMSAGVSTSVGGRTGGAANTPQFEISDPRSVAETAAAVKAGGFQPVYKDWEPI